VGWLRRWLPRLVLALALIMLVGYRVLTDPARIKRLTQAYVQQFFSTPVTIGSVEFSLTTGIQLTDVQVADPDGGPGRPSLLSIDGMWLQHDPLDLLVGRVTVNEVVATRPVCLARYAADSGKFNIQRALRAPAAEGRPGLRQLPVLRVRDAHLLMYANTDPGSPAVEDVALSLTATPDAHRRYVVAWRAQTDRRSQGRFAIDLRRGIVEDEDESGAPWLSLEAASLAIEATEPQAGRWIDLLGVRGQFRIVDFALGFRGAAEASNRLTMEFESARLSVPVAAEEDALPPEKRFIRLEDVSGRVAVDETGASADLSGYLGDARCRLRGHMAGDVSRDKRFAELGFQIEADVEGLTLPHWDDAERPWEARFVNRWRRMRHFYRDFDPHGRVDVTATLSKAPGADAGIELQHALIQARGGDVTIRMFPYRVDDVRGTLELTSDGVFIHGLTGRHGEGAISAEGWFGELSRHSAATLHVEGLGVALDSDLCTAISGRHRHTWEEFAPRGRADIAVTMSRPETEDEPGPWTVGIDAELLGVDAEFVGFPYPLRDLRGRVRIDGDTFEVVDVRGSCGDGALTAAGLVRASPAGLEQLDLTLTADALPLDDTLLNALPPAGRAEVAELHAQGEAAVAVNLTDCDGEVVYDIDATVADVDLCPEKFPLPVTGLSGSLRIQPQSVELHDLRGNASDGVVRASGRIVRGDTGENAVTIRGEQVRLTEALRSALPDDVRAQLEPWDIRGRFDVERRMGASSGQTLRLELDGATVTYAPFPLAWRITTGDVVVEDERVWLRGVRAVSGAAELSLAGEVDADGGALRYTLRGLKLDDEAVRMALPWRLRRQWNDLAPEGSLDVFDGMLDWRVEGDSRTPVWQLAGDVQLYDVGFLAGVKVSGMSGRIALGGEARRTLADVFLKGDLHLDRLTIGKYTLANLTGRVLRDGVGKRLRFDELAATFYGGAVTGTLDLDAGRGATEYSLEATVQRAAVQGLVAAQRTDVTAHAPDNLHGYVDGRFFLTGTLGDSQGRRGGGRLQVRDAELYRLPLLLAVLHVLNLSIPEESAFQSASAGLLVVGDEVRFKDIELVGEALTLVGNGTMVLPSGALDLELIAVSPFRWADMPVLTEMLEGMARELLEVQVTGTLGEPRATAQPLRNMEAALEALLTLQRLPEDERPAVATTP